MPELSNAELLLYLATAVYGIVVLISVVGFWTRAEKIEGIAALGVAIATIIVALSLIIRGITLDRLPLTGLYEFILAFVLFLGISYFVLRRKISNTALMLTLSLTCFLGMALAITVPHSDAPLMPALKSIWLSIHVVTAIIAYGSFGIAAMMSLLYLVHEKGEDKNMALYDEISYKAIAMGFIFQTLLLVTGAVWAEEVWGTWWSWDPKETWALITWFIYATALHGYKRRNWAGRKAAWFSLFGFVVVLFTMLGVTFILPGMHSYL